MIKFDLLKLAIYNWVHKELGLTAIWEEQSEVRPAKPYVSMKLITGPVKTGTDDLRQDAEGVFSVQGLRMLTLSVSVYGADSLASLSTLQTSIEKPSVQEVLRSAGLSFIRADAVQDLTIQRENRFESRHQMDVQFYTAEVEVDDGMTTIDTVELNNEVDGSVTVINP